MQDALNAEKRKGEYTAPIGIRENREAKSTIKDDTRAIN